MTAFRTRSQSEPRSARMRLGCNRLAFSVIAFSVALLTTNVRASAYAKHWWSQNNNHNQIGYYQVPDDGNRSPPRDYDHQPYPPNQHHEPRMPKDIMVDVINNMGLALLEAHNEHNENNIAISPYGAASVLIVLLEGLVGEAAYEIKIAMQLPSDSSVVRIGLRDIHRHLKSYFIPKEGFLAGLTLSHDNITLNREYQAILKFYGYDIETFNGAMHPDVDTSTNGRPTVTMATEGMKPTTTSITSTISPSEVADGGRMGAMTTVEASEATTLETISTMIDKLTSTLPGDREDSDSQTTTDSPADESPSTTSKPPTTRTREQSTTTEMLTTTELPPPNIGDVESSTSTKLPARSYTTEAIDVIDTEMQSTTLKTAETEEPVAIENGEDTDVVIADTTLGAITKQELNSMPEERFTSGEQSFHTKAEFELNTIRMPAYADGKTEISSFETTKDALFEITTYSTRKNGTQQLVTSTGLPSVTEGFQPTTLPTTRSSAPDLGSNSRYEVPEENTLKYDTSFEGTTFFAMESTQDNSKSTVTVAYTTTLSDLKGTTDSEVVTLAERNEFFAEIKQKLTKLEPTTTTTSLPIPDISFTTSEPITAYTQTQHTEATSLEDRILEERTLPASNQPLSTSSLQIAAKITPAKSKATLAPTRRTRSVVDYLILRYYDNYHANNRRYVPPSMPKTRYASYQPEEPYTFLVNGIHRETNISFMTYDTILPFYYIRALDALALSFPLDSDMYYLLLVLPLDAHGIDRLVYEMRRATSLRHIVERLEYTHVKAVIPSFMLKGYVVLTPTLQKLCIRKIFEPRHANFAPMTPEPNLYVTNIEQAVTVTIRNYVDPAGHSARNLHHYRPVEFRADHPFLYFVMDSQIHVNLMAGKIINPLNSRIR